MKLALTLVTREDVTAGEALAAFADEGADVLVCKGRQYVSECRLYASVLIRPTHVFARVASGTRVANSSSDRSGRGMADHSAVHPLKWMAMKQRRVTDLQ